MLETPDSMHTNNGSNDRGIGSRFGLMFWVQVGLGLAVAGFGISLLHDRGWRSPTGFLILCIGVMLLPFWIARLLGGVAILALAAWLAMHAAGPIDYLLAALYAFVGFSSAAEGYRGFRKPRENASQGQ